ncbi:MAG: dTDP-4-dehydrorhamnose 3,5-epimerase, partial [Flavobacteriaceae bacterium CG17_big_fil_post_rev_8_21_14_2_50_31_13]
DDRGLFVKTFHKNTFHQHNLAFEIRESYFSVSKRDVIRGMHFQLPPHDHEKLVFVPKGAIVDVVVDLRQNSSTYLQHISVELSEQNKKSIFIPKGLAHGFKSLQDDTITVYNVATEYNPTADAGIHYHSLGFDWAMKNPILSKRDQEFPTLEEFSSKNPF